MPASISAPLAWNPTGVDIFDCQGIGLRSGHFDSAGDDLVHAGVRPLDYAASRPREHLLHIVSDASFNPAVVQFRNDADASPFVASSVFVGGSNAGPNSIVPGTADFSINFFTDRNTGAVPAGRFLIPYQVATFYSLAGNSTTYSTFDNTISIIPPPVMSAVPEPATWAMMIFGIGAVGGSLRRRKSKVTTRIAFA